jgi:hypothetical protein
VASSRQGKGLETLDRRKDVILKGEGKHLAQMASKAGACTTLRWPSRLRNLS